MSVGRSFSARDRAEEEVVEKRYEPRVEDMGAVAAARGVGVSVDLSHRVSSGVLRMRSLV